MFRLALFLIFCFSQLLTGYSQLPVQTQINFYIVVCGNYGFFANEKSIGEIFLMPSVVGNHYTNNDLMNCVLPCDGRQLEVSKYKELYTLIGTNYGGGKTYFNIPYLQYNNGVMITSPPSTNQSVVVPQPSLSPISQPVVVPPPPSINQPVVALINLPSNLTASPTTKPTANPTVKPTANPTVKPTANPTVKPTTRTNTLRK